MFLSAYSSSWPHAWLNLARSASVLYSLRAAAASASWQALSMISGTTPFSFAMACICCNRGLTVAIFLHLQPSRSEFHVEAAALDLRERHAVGPASLFEPYDAVLHTSETSRKRRLAVYRLP